jgi:hypothetical protein
MNNNIFTEIMTFWKIYISNHRVHTYFPQFSMEIFKTLHNFCTHIEVMYLTWINGRENQRGIQEWRIQRHIQHWTQDTEQRQTKQKKHIAILYFFTFVSKLHGMIHETPCYIYSWIFTCLFDKFSFVDLICVYFRNGI